MFLTENFAAPICVLLVLCQKTERVENQRVSKIAINKANSFAKTISKKNGKTVKKARKTLKKTPYILCFRKFCVPLQSILDNGDRKFNKLKDNAYIFFLRRGG